MAHTSSPFKLAASCPFATSSNWRFNGFHRDRPSYKMGPKARPRLSPCLGGSRFWERSSLKISSDTFSWSASLPPAEARFSLCFDRRVSEDMGESGGLWVRGGWYWGLTGLTGTASTSSPGTTWTRSGMSMSSRRDSGECFSRSSSSLTESLRLLRRSRGPAWNTKWNIFSQLDQLEQRRWKRTSSHSSGDGDRSGGSQGKFRDMPWIWRTNNDIFLWSFVNLFRTWWERLEPSRTGEERGQHCYPLLLFTLCLSPLTSLDTRVRRGWRGDERRGCVRVAKKLKEKRLLLLLRCFHRL